MDVLWLRRRHSMKKKKKIKRNKKVEENFKNIVNVTSNGMHHIDSDRHETTDAHSDRMRGEVK